MTLIHDSSDSRQQVELETHVVSDYCMYREEAFRQLGMSTVQAIAVVEFERSSDISEFTEMAVNFEAYRQLITAEPNGISVESFQHVLTVNPGLVIAHATEWARVRQQ